MLISSDDIFVFATNCSVDQFTKFGLSFSAYDYGHDSQDEASGTSLSTAKEDDDEEAPVRTTLQFKQEEEDEIEKIKSQKRKKRKRTKEKLSVLKPKRSDIKENNNE